MNIVVDGYNICVKTTGTGDKTVVILQGWVPTWECMILWQVPLTAADTV